MADIDTRAPYTHAEWVAICAALRAERARRGERPFPQAQQSEMVSDVVRSLRSAVQGSLGLGPL